MDDHLLQLPLSCSSLHDLLVDGVSGDEPVDHDWLGLANPVAPVLRLEVLLGVPVTVVDDAGVSSCQVDTQTTSPVTEIRVNLD